MTKRADILGHTFNYLTAIEYVGNKKWLFKCICGNENIIRTDYVLQGKRKSCGCKNPKPKGNLKHGLYGTKFYNIWHLVKTRCNNKQNKYYGGRGISTSEEWKNFNKFKEDMYETYLKYCDIYDESKITILQLGELC